jgi:hypothetical protein
MLRRSSFLGRANPSGGKSQRAYGLGWIMDSLDFKSQIDAVDFKNLNEKQVELLKGILVKCKHLQYGLKSKMGESYIKHVNEWLILDIDKFERA